MLTTPRRALLGWGPEIRSSSPRQSGGRAAGGRDQHRREEEDHLPPKKAAAPPLSRRRPRPCATGHLLRPCSRQLPARPRPRRRAAGGSACRSQQLAASRSRSAGPRPPFPPEPTSPCSAAPCSRSLLLPKLAETADLATPKASWSTRPEGHGEVAGRVGRWPGRPRLTPAGGKLWCGVTHPRVVLGWETRGPPPSPRTARVTPPRRRPGRGGEGARAGTG